MSTLRLLLTALGADYNPISLHPRAELLGFLYGSRRLLLRLKSLGALRVNLFPFP